MYRLNPYNILGVNPTDSLRTVKHAWHRLTSRYNPDEAEQTEEIHEGYVLIQNAYETIYREKSEGPETLQNAQQSQGQHQGQGTSHELNYRAAANMIDRLDRSLVSFFALEETILQLDGLIAQMRDLPEASWGPNAPTQAILDSLSELIARHDEMVNVYRRLESDARVVENAPIGRRWHLLRVLVTHAALWPQAQWLNPYQDV
ncbi:hypothetical protein O1611_g7746 [Lasiodiplodia mahajangana]|uniref:Uncharacterized protein n=1 Tax=Lasiodiplodia mahajangana TaxID=1108764 RepID=A0ACC2JF09_9PEZI|nr:hypothetical protein O1611_g7746 [Lasiodiplodia mahajangana]